MEEIFEAIKSTRVKISFICYNGNNENDILKFIVDCGFIPFLFDKNIKEDKKIKYILQNGKSGDIKIGDYLVFEHYSKDLILMNEYFFKSIYNIIKVK